jgi:hypothetical protein
VSVFGNTGPAEAQLRGGTGDTGGRYVLRKQRVDESIGAGAVPATVVSAENALPRKARPLCNTLRRDVLWVRMKLQAAKSHLCQRPRRHEPDGPRGAPLSPAVFHKPIAD